MSSRRKAKSSAEESDDGFLTSVVPLMVIIGLLGLAMISWCLCCKKPKRQRTQTPGTTQPRTPSNVEAERFSAANAEMANLLNSNGTTSQPPLSSRIAAADLRFTNTRFDLSAPPPTYNQIERRLSPSRNTSASNSNSRWTNFNSAFYRPITSFDATMRDLTPSNAAETHTRTREVTEQQLTRSWVSYLNTANRLRELTANSNEERAVSNLDSYLNTRIRYSPEPNTPPPMYHEVEGTAAQDFGTNILPPSYDEFMATPHKYSH